MKKISLLILSVLAFACLMPVQKVLAVDSTVSTSLSHVQIVSPEGTNQVLADNEHSAVIMVTVKNPAGVALVERLVTLTPSAPVTSLTPTQGYTNGSGVIYFTVRSITPSDIQFTANVNGTVLNDKPTVAFIGNVSAADSTITLSKSTAIGDGIDSVNVTVTAKDTAGHLIEGKTASISVDAPAVTISPRDAITNNKGQAVFAVKSIQVQNVPVVASADGILVNQQKTIIFEAPFDFNVSNSMSAVTASPSSIVADNTQTTTVTVSAKNASGIGLSGKTVNLSSSFAGLTITPAQAATDQNGNASFTVKSSSSGTPTFVTVVGGVTLSHQPSVNFTAVFDNAVSASGSAVYLTSPAVSTQIVADNTQSGVITVVARNAAGIVLSGRTVSLTSSFSGMTIVGLQTVTDNNGIATFSIKSSVAGSPTFVAIAGGVTLSAQPTVEFINQISTDKSYMTTTENSVAANYSDYNAVDVYILNADNVPLSGKTVALTGLVPGMMSNPSQATTDSQGKASFQVISSVPATATIGATADEVTINQQKTITFTAVSAGTGAVSSQYSSFWSNYSSINIGTAVTLRVRIADQSNSPLANKTVNVAVSNEGYNYGYNLTTDAYGNATMQFSPPASGYVYANATVDGIALPQVSVQVLSLSNPTNQTVSASQSSVSISPTSVIIDSGEVVLSAYVRNSSGQALSNKTVQVYASASMTATPSSVLSDSNGYATFRLKFHSVGSVTLSVVVGGVTLSQKPTVAVSMPYTGACMFAPGTLIKLYDDSNPNTQDDTAVYYYGRDCKRHSFPNSQTYFTWYGDFNSVQQISLQTMSQIALGSNATYRPGVRLVKFQTLNKVYAVSKGGILKWIISENLAKVLYGQGWSQLVQDIPDTFYGNYVFGPAIYHNYEYSRLGEMDMTPTIDDNM
ncbi:MAG: Ig-like domain-containing protein [Patescibacteria group bacterium]|nr:Ig-like domain-containing protein [Patescibacteria group bacterium]